MKICPHCAAELAETAVRCGACRKPLERPARSVMRPLLSRGLSGFNARFAEDVPFSRGLVPAAVVVALMFVFAWALESSGLGVTLLKFLKSRYAVFSQEPVLVWQIYVFLQTFALKLGICVFLWIYVASTGVSPRRALGLEPRGRLEPRAFAAFLIFSAAVGVTQGLDPLSPAFPMHSFFGDALVWGNVAAVFSIAVVAPVAEEIVFRGFLYPALNRAFGAAAAVVGVSLLFAAAHIRPEIDFAALSLIFCASIGLTLARVRTGSTRAAICLHALYNTTILASGALRYALFGY